MIVTRIQAVTKQKYKVEIDEQLAFVLYKGELSRYHIREQEPIEEEIYREIVEEILVKRAKLRAMHLLTKRDMTEQELEDKLTRGGYPRCAIREAVAYVKSYGYIDDKRYVKNYIECQQQKKGIRRIAMELSQKGVPKEVIQEVSQEIQGPDPREQIRELVEKRRKSSGKMDDKEKQRLYGYLMRRGFTSGDIWEILSERQEF